MTGKLRRPVVVRAAGTCNDGSIDDCLVGKREELCAVLCATVVASQKHSYEQFFQLNAVCLVVGFSLSLFLHFSLCLF